MSESDDLYSRVFYIINVFKEYVKKVLDVYIIFHLYLSSNVPKYEYLH